MICKYCQQEVNQISKLSDDKVAYVNYMCEVCHVDYEYVVRGEEEPVLSEETLFAIKIKDKKFEVRYFYQAPQMTVVYRIIEDFQLGKGGFKIPRYSNQIIHTFNHLLDWTPFNAKDKLELLLPFF